jgi:dihydrofolate synthase / folylpolyglutamate synthase
MSTQPLSTQSLTTPPPSPQAVSPLTPMSEQHSLDQWLAYIEGLHPKNIEMGLERVRAVWLRTGLQFSCPVVTVAGTNGKGSTCAMLESIYTQAGYRTAVYSSPHLVHFLERCRIAGEMVDAADFIAACAMIERARLGLSIQKPQSEPLEIPLTYFEFTTLAFFALMGQKSLDVAILEVGLGGRLDAVNIIDTDCAIITSIDLDHMEYLGDNREAIGFEKAGILRAGKPAVVSDPMPPASIAAHAKAIGAELYLMGTDFNFSGDKQQWGWAGRDAQHAPRRYAGLAYPALRGANQLMNASGVLAAITALRDLLPVTAQAVRNGLAFVELPGRFQIVPGEPALVLDVAHNPHSVAALAANLDAMGFYPTTHAVFGAMADKDLAAMWPKVAPMIDKWYFTDLPTARAASALELQKQWQAQNQRKDASSAVYTSPQAALDAAVAGAAATDRIVVFGSFYTVGGVLQHGTPRLNAKHLNAST